MGATLRFEELDATFGAVVTGARLAELDERGFAELHEGWVEHGLIVAPDQHLTRAEQDALARRFGPLEFEATALTNVRSDGTLRGDADDDVVKLLRGNEGWHHDSTYLPVQARGAVFSAEIVPDEGGATGWADMRAAYDALDDATRERVAGLAAHHSLRYSQERAGQLPSADEDGVIHQYGYHDDAPPLRPLVKVHPDTGRPNLVIGRHAHAVPGMDPAESEALLDALNAEAVADPSRTHHHEWSVGDVVIWDNRRLMHRATPFDLAQPRRMWHTRVAGDPATETALNHDGG